LLAKNALFRVVVPEAQAPRLVVAHFVRNREPIQVLFVQVLRVKNLISGLKTAVLALHQVLTADFHVEPEELGAVEDGAAVVAIVGNSEAFFVLDVLLQVEHSLPAMETSLYTSRKG
jgi:hypothetical protein